ncbi:hypothetical protein QSO_3224 [Clostridioides difficile P31]|nr:hypothetical protein QO5_3346 [Clostridioides difficile F253]EQJ37783.1 hypothetical protein QSC_3212 [Clostridioides difficile P23]EQJ76744.1 hypothetical protein QU5_3224 [Clostridioides difficile P45]EQK85358.1 hypothetical protein QSO_3224 [Clostridioides difficile P31]
MEVLLYEVLLYKVNKDSIKILFAIKRGTQNKDKPIFQC